MDKLNDKGVDKFGYGAIHYIVQLSKQHSGARYDNLKNLNCEIQVRTVLQDAWSIIDHHLVYKNASDVPKQLRRKLNSLAGLFETADDQFNQLRIQRGLYIEKVIESRNRPSRFLEEELNIDSFRQYIEWKFPDLPIEVFFGQLEVAYYLLNRDGRFKKLIDIDMLVEQTKNRFEEINNRFNDDKNFKSSSVAVIMCIALSNDSYKDSFNLPDIWIAKME